MCTAHFPWSGRGLCPTPWMQTPLDADLTLLDADPHPWMKTPPPSHVTSNACWEANSPPPVDRMTDTCKNITLLQTLFAGGNNVNNEVISKPQVMWSRKELKYCTCLPEPVRFNVIDSINPKSNSRWCNLALPLSTVTTNVKLPKNI